MASESENRHQRLMQRDAKLYKRSQEGCKFLKLYDRVIHADNVMAAYKALIHDYTSKFSSVDGLTINDLRTMSFDEILCNVRAKMMDYKSCIIKQTYDFHYIPSIWDRLIQQCILQVLRPIYKSKFNKRNYGYGSNKTLENAVADISFKLNKQHLSWAVSVDMDSVLDNISHNKLIKILRKNGILDEKLLMIIKSMLRSKIKYADGHIEQATSGVLHCGKLGLLLANIYLNEFDWWISDQWETFNTKNDYTCVRNDVCDNSHKYRALRSTNLKEMYIIRYNGRAVIITDTEEHADAVKHSVSMWLRDNLKLNVSSVDICDMRHEFLHFLDFDVKLMKKGRNKDNSQRYVIESHVSHDAIDKIHNKLLDQIKQIQRAGNSQKAMRAVVKYNEIVIDAHRKYSIATCCNDDFNTLGASIQKQLYNHLVKNNDAKRGGTKNFQRFGLYCGSDSRYKHYMNSKTVRWYRNYPILPIGYIQHRYSMIAKRNMDVFNDLP